MLSALRLQCRRPTLLRVAGVRHWSKLAKPAPAFEKYTRHPQRGQSPKAVEDSALRVAPHKILQYFAENAEEWRKKIHAQAFDRLLRFGIPREFIRPLLKEYVAEMEKGNVLRALKYSKVRLNRISLDLSLDGHFAMDRYYTRMLFQWASLPKGQAKLKNIVPPEVIGGMQELFRAADFSGIAWEFGFTRSSRPRKFIMHVGPTNSGKTHNALRALAAAKRGLYAGPLRLLAFEIFDRLNKGQIVPLGEEPSAEAEADDQATVVDGDAVDGEGASRGAVVTKTGDARFVRPCNMLTGEEHKLVSEDAPLLSCTVEMVPLSSAWDVAVIDEIQLIADRQRGGAWTTAVMGLNAAEIHLCGEESAVPLIESIVRDLGDELVVKRYQRLSPLIVADESLGGDLSKVEKGDCAVAFSRTGLFQLKSDIERKAKLRCALAYGRLPPEIRAEQAALFNDPKSDYNVLVGSDAIGMGLNLKIKRIIFEAVEKFNGRDRSPLTTSGIKQIAGRAGRYGLHDKDAVGVVTTLHEEDLPVIRKALEAPFDPLHFARLALSSRMFMEVVGALPPDATNRTVNDVCIFVSNMSPLFEIQGIKEISTGIEVIDEFLDCFTARNRLMMQNAPCPWRDGAVAQATRVIMGLYRENLRVPIDEALYRSRMLPQLNKALAMMQGSAGSHTAREIDFALSALESIHKAVVLYLWLAHRQPVAFPDMAKALRLRQLTEHAMDWCLEVIHQMRIGASDPAAKAREKVILRRPLEEIQYAAKAGLSNFLRNLGNSETDRRVNLVR